MPPTKFLAVLLALALGGCGDDDADAGAEIAPAEGEGESAGAGAGAGGGEGEGEGRGEGGAEGGSEGEGEGEGKDEEPPNEGGDEGTGDFEPGEGEGEGEGEQPPPRRCVAVPAPLDPRDASGGPPPPMGPGGGIDAWETSSYDLLVEAVLAADEAHFVATLDRQRDLLVVQGVDGGRVVFDRALEVVEGAIDTVFPSTESEVLGGYDELLSAFENPGGGTLEGLGYDPDGDPRVGWLPVEAQSYPLALLRLNVLFNAPDAPDAIVAWRSWSRGGAGTHGGMGLLQSRATLILSGAGVRRGVVLDRAGTLADVAPTVLAALGAETTGGLGPDGRYDDGLYLVRQDGRVLTEALTSDEDCDAPDHVIVALFDGLMATELNHQLLDDDAEVDLPTLKSLAGAGVVYRYGAVCPYPSMSSAGHMTVGTGVWSGHHGFVHNTFYRRSTGEVFDPLALLSNPAALIADPLAALDVVERAIAPGVETLSQAAHRGLGPDAFVAVINDLPLIGADYSTIDYVVENLGAGGGAGGENFALDRYDLADELAVQQVQTLLRDPDRPIPTILEVAFMTTDKGGEGAGPHSGLLREKLVDSDRRLALILKDYERLGVLDRTLIILTSDHGMELQDPTRRHGVDGALSRSGLRYTQPGSGLIYLRTLEVHTAPAEDGLTVRVINHDNGAPVVGALVTCDECALEAPATTDDEGAAWVPWPDAAGRITLGASHVDFNNQSITVERPPAD